MAHETEIAQLETILNTGAGQVTVDGVTVRYHGPDVIRKRLSELYAKQDAAKRPRLSRIDHSTAF